MNEIESKIRDRIGNQPYIFRQAKVRQELDGLSAPVMANMDAQGRGPGGRLLIGRKVAYPVDAYIDWLMNRISEAG